MLKTPRTLHILHSVPLHLVILSFLLQNTQQLMITRIRPYTMNNRKREFALRQILAKPLIPRIRRIREIQIVVADLENQAHDVDERNAVLARGGLGLHELYGESEEAAGFVADHFEVFVFGRAGEGVAPEEVHALAAVEVEEFFDVDVDCGGVM